MKYKFICCHFGEIIYLLNDKYIITLDGIIQDESFDTVQDAKQAICKI